MFQTVLALSGSYYVGCQWPCNPGFSDSMHLSPGSEAVIAAQVRITVWGLRAYIICNCHIQWPPRCRPPPPSAPSCATASCWRRLSAAGCRPLAAAAGAIALATTAIHRLWRNAAFTPARGEDKPLAQIRGPCLSLLPAWLPSSRAHSCPLDCFHC